MATVAGVEDVVMSAERSRKLMAKVQRRQRRLCKKQKHLEVVEASKREKALLAAKIATATANGFNRQSLRFDNHKPMGLSEPVLKKQGFDRSLWNRVDG